MNQDNVPVTITILEKEYRIACPRSEKNALLAAAEYLARRMKEIRNSGKVVGMDRVAVLAALNITHELLSQQSLQHQLNNRLRVLQDRIGDVVDTKNQELD